MVFTQINLPAELKRQGDFILPLLYLSGSF